MFQGDFAGVVRFDGAAVDPNMEDQLARAAARLRTRPINLGRPEAAFFVGATPRRSAAGAAFIASARLDNRRELADALGLSSAQLSDISDADLLERMFERWGDAGLGRCLGAFAFARWDPKARRLTLGRDCLGERTLFFHRGANFVAFATSLKVLLSLPDAPRDLDEMVLANYLALNLTAARRTFYRAIDRVPSRTLVTIDPGGVRDHAYWSPDLATPPPYRRETDYAERARELLDQAVATATQGSRHVAISTSGGLDSSAIAATAARLGRAEKITCYSLVAPPGLQVDPGPFKYVDERGKVEALGRMHPSMALHFLAPDRPHALEADDTRLFLRGAAPILNPTNAGFFAFLYDAVVADGHERLQIGGMGNLGLTWSGLFSLSTLARNGKWGALAQQLVALASETNRSLLRTFVSEVLVRGGPAPLRRSLLRLAGRDPDSAARHSALNPAFIADHGLAAAWRSEAFDPQFAIGAQDPAAYRAEFMFDRNQFARDYQASSFEQRGFEVRDAHSDRRLLEFMLKVPEPMFRQDGVSRSFARAVLADRLPPQVLDERRSGAQDAQWFSRLSLRREAIRAQIERLEGSAMARRLLDLPRLKRLADDWPRDSQEAETRIRDYRLALMRGVHVGRFIRWVEGGNA